MISENNEKPNFYAIIPANVRYCERLTPNSKLLFGEISALSDKTWFCYASNAYFWKIYWVSNRSISFWISNLEKEWFIQIIQNEITWKRLIKMFVGVEENFLGVGRKLPGGQEENFQHNNIIINTDNRCKNNSKIKDLERMQKMSQFNIQ